MQKLFFHLILFLITASICALQLPVFGSLPTNPVQNISQSYVVDVQQLERQGQSLYEIQQYAEAIAVFLQAGRIYANKGSNLRQAISLSNVALCYQQLGRWFEANKAISESLKLLQASPEDTQSPSKFLASAQILSIQGGLQFAQGKTEPALASWQQAAGLYSHLIKQDPNNEVLRDRLAEVRINQGQVLLSVGLPRRALEIFALVLNSPTDPTLLKDWQNWIQALPISVINATALQGFGEALRITGKLEKAEFVIRCSLKMAEKLQQLEISANSTLKLANVLQRQAQLSLILNDLSFTRLIELVNQHEVGRRFRDTEAALKIYYQFQIVLDLYERASALAQTSLTQVNAEINQINLLIELQQGSDAATLASRTLSRIDALPPTRSAVDAQINLARGLLNLKKLLKNVNQDSINLSTYSVFKDYSITLQLVNAIKSARLIQDIRAESFALGVLGELYESSEQWKEAESVTRQATALAQSVQAREAIYLWQWQLGRILKAQGKAQPAVTAYQSAVSTLNEIRKELTSSSFEEQLSFRNMIEPIHRELVALILEHNELVSVYSNLQVARTTIESLQLFELSDFLQENCLVANPQQIDQLDAKAAIFYPIILPNSIGVILSLPNQPPIYYGTSTSKRNIDDEIEAITSKLRSAVRQPNTPESSYLPAAQQLYDWLIRPAIPYIQQQQLQTLVFVLDGTLRDIPIAALHDHVQNQYLIEQYSIAISPGLQLLERKPIIGDRQGAFVAGLTEARPPFPALPAVKIEFEQIQNQIPNSKIRLNQQFTQQVLRSETQTNSFPIIHLATHGQFTSQLDSTFILTWDERLTVNQLKDLLQASTNHKQPLELLVLSACETAVGDRRAALGLAGIAIKAGARSTLATLWQVNDAASAELIGRFYQELVQNKAIKAEALRRAQIALLKNKNLLYQHPYFWAGYVLIGNWQ